MPFYYYPISDFAQTERRGAKCHCSSGIGPLIIILQLDGTTWLLEVTRREKVLRDDEEERIFSLINSTTRVHAAMVIPKQLSLVFALVL